MAELPSSSLEGCPASGLSPPEASNKNEVTSIQRIPSDIFKNIFRFARVPDLIAFTQACRYLHELASDDVGIKYAIEAHFAGAVELTDLSGDIDVLTETTVYDRHSLLRSREKSWRNLPLNSWETVDVPFEASHIHGLGGGVVELGVMQSNDYSNASVLRYAILPEAGAHELGSIMWKELNFGAPIYSTAISLYENDLTAAIILAPVPNEPLVTLNIHLVQLTTGLSHPLASRPQLSGPEFRSTVQPDIRGQVLGKYLVVIVSFVFHNLLDRFLVYDWISGDLLLDHSASEPGVFLGVTFLSPTIVALTDRSDDLGALSLWELTPTPTHFGTLLLPQLRDGRSYSLWYIRHEPGLALSRSPTTRLPAVRYNPHASIITLRVSFDQFGSDSAIFVCRYSKLLEAAERLRALGFGADEEPPSLEYCDWGRHAARWIPANDLEITTEPLNGGQRVVTIHKNAQDIGSKITVYDFNPFHVRKWMDEASDGDSNPAPPSQPTSSPRLFLKRSSHTLDGGLPFCETLVDELPYIMYESRQSFHYDAVWTDGDRIVGVKMNENGQCTSMEFAHFG